MMTQAKRKIGVDNFTSGTDIVSALENADRYFHSYTGPSNQGLLIFSDIGPFFG